MEATSNVGEQPNVKPEDTVNTNVEQNQEPTQEQKNPEEVSPEEQLQPTATEELQADPTQNLTEVLEAKEEPFVYEKEEVKEEPLSPDEQILDNWLNNGKTEVSMNELINAGFDGEGLDPQTNIIGRFKVSRMLLVNPFKIERNV